ncbi:MAG: tRNA pseudouridine(38-40) synthase TruA [Betaproteobacteria bacterium]|nr:tRNA pseudouridine(38-40) synthase TruA [Betaproteobacteria bacterium]MDE1981577.1 tRNA pseudouridine(38-40) synthase TruA [Betaproteobacteria bacterium]MDE2131793.1 tRNA pseudouridine(38-40) synthase TruA [Betaproteobacteria bacterium]MDE2211738.1 tRNA pseudouridine(38-40) synthase TruA [Betaproteobacteria bacterium]
MRFALGVEYDGSGFCGWQRQPDQASVQGALESALGGIAGEPVTVVAAGRTDRGVHASGQVVHFDTQASRPLTAWVRGANALLPAGIAVLWAHPVPDSFHARFCATRRSYQYLLLNHPVRNALMQGKWGWFHQTLDLGLMREAARMLLGTHDFSAFRAAECQAKSPVKTLAQADIAANGPLLQFSFTADAFLQHMVRNMVGALVAVGAGREAPAWLGTLLESRDRTRGAPTFPPDGLYLTGVGYADDWQLPAPATRYHGAFMQARMD